MLFIKRIFLLIPIVVLLNGCFGGLASLGKILKISAFMHIFTGWGGRIAAIRYFSQEHTVTFYAIIIIILLIIAFVIYLEINSQEDYLIRPYKILLGISLIAIVIYIIASAPEQKEPKLEMFDYSDTPKLTIDMLKYPYEDEETWIKEIISCQSLEDEKKIQYCLETKEACSEFIVEKNKNMKPFSTCVSKVRERLEMPSVMGLFYNPTKTDEREDGKINWGKLYNEPFSNFKTIEKRWGTMTSEKKLQVVRNIFATGTTYDQFPDWLKNDPAAIEIKEELKKPDTNQ